MAKKKCNEIWTWNRSDLKACKDAQRRHGFFGEESPVVGLFIFRFISIETIFILFLESAQFSSDNRDRQNIDKNINIDINFLKLFWLFHFFLFLNIFNFFILFYFFNVFLFFFLYFSFFYFASKFYCNLNLNWTFFFHFFYFFFPIFSLFSYFIKFLFFFSFNFGKNAI